MVWTGKVDFVRYYVGHYYVQNNVDIICILYQHIYVYIYMCVCVCVCVHVLVCELNNLLRIQS